MCVCVCVFMHLSIVFQRPQDDVRSPEGAGTVLGYVPCWFCEPNMGPLLIRNNSPAPLSQSKN